MTTLTSAELYPGFDLDCPAINTPIEAGILPVCDVLNALPGVYTLWSCEGHPEIQMRPYVTFIATQETAFKLDGLLRSSHQFGLHYRWGVTANFRMDGSLQYTIGPNDYRLEARSSRWWWQGYQWNLRVMKRELKRLASALAQATR